MGSLSGCEGPVLFGSMWFVTRVRANKLPCSIRGIVVVDAGWEEVIWGVELRRVVQWRRRRV